MDEIAAQAAVSKQTVYKHFADKATLFAAIVTSTVDRAGDPVHREVLELQDSGSLETDLRDLARRQLLAVMQPQLLALRRLIIGESGRFPELGRVFYERGQQRTMGALAERVRAPRGARRAGCRRPRARRPALQLADHGDAAEPRDAPGRRRAARAGRARPPRRRPACAPSWPPTARAERARRPGHAYSAISSAGVSWRSVSLRKYAGARSCHSAISTAPRAIIPTPMTNTLPIPKSEPPLP